MLPNVVELRHAHWFWLPDLHAAGPVSHPAHPDGGVAVPGAVLYAFAGRRSAAAEDDGVHDAGVLRLHLLEYASGLALYWSVGNLIGIVQQAVMNRTSLGREMREIAAKRARRKATTIQARK